MAERWSASAEILLIDGRPAPLTVRRAETWFRRASGIWSEWPWPRDRVLLIPACRAVHTFALGVAIDVVFSDEEGRVIAEHTGVSPWRIRHHPAACATWEFAGGVASHLGVRKGTRLGVRRFRGSTLVEFLIAAMLVFLPMVFLTLELSRLSVSRHVLQHAVNDAAREAGFATEDGMALRRSVGYGLMPLYVGTDPGGALDRRRGDAVPAVTAPRGLAALGRAYAETLRMDLLEVQLESDDGTRQWVGWGAITWPTVGGVWRLRVRHCRELVFPLAREIIPAMVRWRMPSMFDQACLARDRFPLEVSALVLRPRREFNPAPRGLPSLPPADPAEIPAVPPTLPDPSPAPSPRPTPDPPSELPMSGVVM